MRTWILILFLSVFQSGINLIACSSKNDNHDIGLNELSKYIKENPDLDTVFLKPGIYKSQEIVIEKKTDKKIVITVRKPGSVIITGKSTLSIESSKNIELSGVLFKETTGKRTLILSNCENVTIANNYFYKCGGGRFAFILALENKSRRNYIQCNTFDANTALSVVVVTSSGVNKKANRQNVGNEISGNLFKNTPDVKSLFPNSDGNGMEAIQLGQGEDETSRWALQTLVYGNHFENIVGDRAEIISVKSSQNSIYENTFLNNKGSISLRLGDRSKVRNNILINTTGGIKIYGRGHQIADNYILGGYYGIQLPAANLKRPKRGDNRTFYQARNLKITRNTIINPSEANIIIGSGYDNGRELVPHSVNISENRLETTKSEDNIIHKIGVNDGKAVTLFNNSLKSKEVVEQNRERNAVAVSELKDNKKKSPVDFGDNAEKELKKIAKLKGASWAPVL